MCNGNYNKFVVSVVCKFSLIIATHLHFHRFLMKTKYNSVIFFYWLIVLYLFHSAFLFKHTIPIVLRAMDKPGPVSRSRIKKSDKLHVWMRWNFINHWGIYFHVVFRVVQELFVFNANVQNFMLVRNVQERCNKKVVKNVVVVKILTLWNILYAINVTVVKFIKTLKFYSKWYWLYTICYSWCISTPITSSSAAAAIWEWIKWSYLSRYVLQFSLSKWYVS